MTLVSLLGDRLHQVAQEVRRASGSRLATGSSRISSSGRFATATVRASWARWPPESLPAFCLRVQAERVDARLRRAPRPSRGSAWRRA